MEMIELMAGSWVGVGGTAGLVLAGIKMFKLVARLIPNDTDSAVLMTMRRVARVISLDVKDR
jgi:hypothetical protein